MVRKKRELDKRVRPRNTGGRILRVVYTALLATRRMAIGGVPSVLSIGGLVRLVQSVNIAITGANISSCDFGTTGISLTCLRDSGFLGGYSDLQKSIVLVNPVITHFNGTVVSGPKKSGVKHQHLSARFVKVRGLKTSFACGRRQRVCRVSTRRLGNASVLLSRTSIAKATGVIVTTMLTGNGAAVCGTTYRPCLRRLYGVLGQVKTGVDKVTSGLLAVRKIRRLRNASRAILPSVVRINDFVNVTTVAHDRVAVGGISCRGLNVVPRDFHHLNVGLRREKSSVFIPTRSYCRVRSFVSNSVVAVTSTP